MFVIRIIQLTIAFNHSYHTCKFDIDWISILLKISKINANFDMNKGPNAAIRLVRRQNHAGTTVSWTCATGEKLSRLQTKFKRANSMLYG